jgi:PAS domain S-box-containing protein
MSGRDEIAELATAFNSMTYQLTSANDLLGEKVVEIEQAREGLKKTNRALKMQLLCNIKLVYADAEDTLLEEVCKLIVNAGGYRMAWVGFAQHDEEKSVLPAAQSGFDEGYLEGMRITWAEMELGQGPTGLAIRKGVTQINQNFLTHPSMTPWREAALARGYQSSIALPLRNGTETFGALTIYSEEPDAFSSEETSLLEDLANELSFGILMQRLRVRNRQSEEALQRSEEKYRLVVEHIPMRIFIKDINSVYLSCNELCARDWGIEQSAIAGKTDFDFFSQELAEQYRADDKRVMDSGRAAEMERKYSLGGKEMYAHTVKVPFRDKDGRTMGVLGMLWDITERKLAEERIRRSEHNLAEAQSMAHLGSWNLDLVSNELDWSAECYRIFEIDPEKFGASYEAFLDIVHPDDREFVNKSYTESVRNHAPYDIVHRLQMKDGRVKYVSEKCETFYNEAGEPVRSAGTTHDITERKLAEDALRDNEERLALATIHNGVGIWDWNLQTQEMIWDDSMYALYHIRREDFSGTEEAWRAS